jgi:DNA (cytosine-5)-methyltransferase 1
MRPRIRVADLFAGCGGLTLGVAEAARRLGLGIDVRLAVDVDAEARAVYEANLPGADFREVSIEELFDGVVGAPLTTAERKLKRQVGRVDVLVGGPPCQGHSDLNNHTRRADPRNALYARMARAAEVLRPAIVLIENVPTVTNDVEKVVDATVRALAAAGYSVAEAIVDISRLGAPQRRHRHVVLASRVAKVNVDDIVSKLEERCPRHPVRSVRWAIEDLNTTKSDELFDSASVASADNLERIAWLFESRKYDLPNSRRPKCHRSDHSYNSMYGRLKWDLPAQTVTTGFGSMGQGRYVHPGRRRTITPHEAARLQMLPDFWDFRAVGKRGALARLIGNAVPPPLVSALLEPALRSLGLAAPVSFPVPPLPKQRKGTPRRIAQEGTTSALRRRSGVPEPSSDGARKRMQAVRQQDTAAELALRAQIDQLALKYESHALLPGSQRRADLLFEEIGVVVLVDGCYWHSCPTHGTSAKANSEWWRNKLATNRRRDRDTDRTLHESGWLVLRFWEHDDPAPSARSIASILAARRAERIAVGPTPA